MKNLKVPVAFVLGDAKSQDQICARYGAYNNQRMCRACHVSFEDSDDQNHECVWVEPSQFSVHINTVLKYYDNSSNDHLPITRMEMKTSEEYLIKHSQHVCINAFDDIDFVGFFSRYIWKYTS